MSGLLQRLFEENGGKVAVISWRPIHSLQGADHRRGPGASGFARSNPVKFIRPVRTSRKDPAVSSAPDPRPSQLQQ
jgi:hypothetical protein